MVRTKESEVRAEIDEENTTENERVGQMVFWVLGLHPGAIGQPGARPCLFSSHIFRERSSPSSYQPMLSGALRL